MDEEILTVKEAAAFLKLSVPTIYQLKAQGKIPFRKVGNSIRFSKNTLTKWISESEGAFND